MSTPKEIELSSLRSTTGVSRYGNGQASAVRRRSLSALGNPPDTHRDLQLTLHSTGAYAVTQNIRARLPDDFDKGEYEKTQHRLFNEVQPKLAWKPWLSGPRGRALQAVVIIIAFILHHELTQYTWQYGNTQISQYGPGVLGTLLALSTSYLCAQELHRTDIQIPDGPIASRKQKLVLHLTHITVITLVASMMAVPILREADLEHVNSRAKRPDYVYLENIVDNLQRVPFFEHRKRDERRSFSESSWSKPFDPRWEVLQSNLSNIFHGPVLFTGQNKPSDFSPIGPAAEGLGFIRPLQPIEKIDRNTLIWKRFMSSEWVISGHLECEMLEVPTDVGIEKNGTMFSVAVPLTDSHGCGATFTFNSTASNEEDRRVLLELVQEYIADLERLSEQTETMFNIVQRAKECQKRLQRYAEAVEAAQHVVAFAQIWKQATPKSGARNPAACQRTYMFAGFSDPLTIIDSSGRLSLLQAASCSTHFQEMEFDINVVSSYLSPFRHADPPPKTAELAYLDIQLHYKTKAENELYLNNIPRDDTFHTRFDEFMLEELESINLVSKHSVYQDLEYRFFTLSRFETESYHSIALGSKHLISAIHQVIADAFSITLLEKRLPLGGWRHSGRDDISIVKIRTLQTEWWFWVIFHGSIALSLILVFSNHCLADDGPSGLPWDMSSIAARAALLHRSNFCRAFRDTNYGPADVKKLRPLRIGHFRVDGDSTAQIWKMDTLLNQPAVGIPEKPNINYRRHDLKSLPNSAGLLTIPFVALILLVMPGIIWAMLKGILESVRDQPTSKYCNISLLFVKHQPGLPTSFNESLVLCVIPVILTMLLVHFWIAGFVQFYKARLPWVGLEQHLPSEKSLTLDYTNCWVPLAKAIKNKHWTLCFMIVSSSLLIPFPMVVTNLYHYEWIVHNIETTLVPRHYVWNFQDFKRDKDVSVAHVLQQVSQGMTNSTALPRWSSYRESILPIDLSAVDETEVPYAPAYNEAGYWEVESVTVRAELECEKMPLSPLGELSPLPFTNTSDGMSIIDPCLKVSDERHLKTSAICSHWQLIDLGGASQEANNSLAWVISVAKVDKGAMLLSQALLCSPRFYTNNGTVQLVSLDGQLHNAHLHNISSYTNEKIITGELDWHFNKLVNESIFEPESDSLRQTSVRLSSPNISISNFRGDVLSFMSYRWAAQYDQSLLDDGVLASMASKVFSLFFATAVPNLGLFETTTPGLKVNVTQKTWTRDIKFHRPYIFASISFLLLSLFVLGLHTITITRNKTYLFPFPPETFENSLFLLCKSNLIEHLGEQIPQPETISLQQFYRRVNRLRLRCHFGLSRPGDSWTQATVIVDAQNYSDSPDRTHITQPFTDVPDDELPLL